MYDTNNAKITKTCGAILRGWCVLHEGLWRFLLVKEACRGVNLNTTAILLKYLSREALREAPLPTGNIVSNVNELKTKPQLIRYYHAAVGFPKKLS